MLDTPCRSWDTASAKKLDVAKVRQSRRQFLKIGGLALGGLSLPQILRAEATSPESPGKKLSHKAIIMIYLSGGPPTRTCTI